MKCPSDKTRISLIRSLYFKIFVTIIISSCIAVGFLLGYKAPEHTSHFIKDAINRKNINAVALGSSSVISLPVDLFVNCQVLVKRGFGGGTLKDLLFYLDFNLLPDSLNLVLVYAGENDIVYGETINQVISRFQTLSRRLAIDFPDAKLVIIKTKLSPSRSSYHERMRKLNRSLEIIDSNPRVKIVGSKLSDQVLPEFYLADGIHLMPEGYEVLLKEVDKEC